MSELYSRALAWNIAGMMAVIHNFIIGNHGLAIVYTPCSVGKTLPY
jgi:hypothetical protein